MNKQDIVYEKISEMHARNCKAAVFVNINGDVAVTALGCARFEALEADRELLLAGVYNELAKVQEIREDVEAAVVELVNTLATDTIGFAAQAAACLDQVEA